MTSSPPDSVKSAFLIGRLKLQSLQDVQFTRDIWALDLGRVFAIAMSLSAKNLRLRAITSKISRLSSSYSLAKMI